MDERLLTDAMALAHATKIRTSVVRIDGRWVVRVRVENEARNFNEPIFVGPFKDQAEADLNAHKIVKLIRKQFGIADA